MTDKAKELGKEIITGVYSNIPDDLNCGLCKREYFSINAMAGLIPLLQTVGGYNYEIVAKEAVRFADALLEELSK